MAKEFLELVVLASFLVVPEWEKGNNTDFDLVDFFSGRARLCRLASWMKLKARAFDVNYTKLRGGAEFKRGKLRRRAMDLNGAAGFVTL